MKRTIKTLLPALLLLCTSCDRVKVAEVVLTLGINSPSIGEPGAFATAEPRGSNAAESGRERVSLTADKEQVSTPAGIGESPQVPLAELSVSDQKLAELRATWDEVAAMRLGTRNGEPHDADQLEGVISRAAELADYFGSRGDARQQDLARDTNALALTIGLEVAPERYRKQHDDYLRQLFDSGHDDPTDVDAAVQRLITYYLTDVTDNAATDAMNRHATIYPDCDMNVQLYSTLVDQLLGAGELTRAVELARAAIKTCEKHPDGAKIKKKLQQVYQQNAGAVGIPMVFVGPTLEGERVDLRKLRGKRVLVTFWASWDPTCRREIPRINELRERYASEGLEVVGVSLDKSRLELIKFTRDKDLRWPQVYSDKASNSNWTNPIARHFGVSTVPHSFLLDTKGVVSANHLSSVSEIEDAILEQLRQEADTVAAN